MSPDDPTPTPRRTKLLSAKSGLIVLAIVAVVVAFNAWLGSTVHRLLNLFVQ